MKDKNEISKIRRKNAKLYPIYKMLSWDLLFFYSINFLFYTITKKITVSQLLIISGIYFVSKTILQIPAVALTDLIGKRKSIIIGNLLVVLHMIVLIICPGAISLIIADIIFALGENIKIIAEPNLLYDSVATRGGDGLYSKIDAKGSSWYYLLDGIASLTAGYLFVINNYLPMFICLGFIIISTIMSFGFEDIYEVKKENRQKNVLKIYKEDLKSSFCFLIHSKRLKSFVLFNIVFYGMIVVISTYRSDLLVEIGVPEEQFSMIFAILTFIGGISISIKKSIEKSFKNRTLSFISLLYITSCIIVGIIANSFFRMSIIPVILIMYVIQAGCTSIWYVLEAKYLKNFTKEGERNRITFIYEFIGGITAGICSVLGGLLLKVVNVRQAFLLVGLFALACMILVLDYMRKRFGLKPEEYKKEDIEF